MLDGLPIDPYSVLGIKRNATPDDVREAFHRKSKKHHPDHGGDDWAFRIVVHAYNLINAEPGSTGVSTPERKPAPPQDSSQGGPIRLGVYDKETSPTRLVLVEILWMRYSVEDVFELLGARSEDRQLGGSIKVVWPDPDLPGDPRGVPFADRILVALNGAFDELRAKTAPLKARSQIDSGRFEAWLNYTNGPTAAAAFKHLHVTLKARGLGVRQWTREMLIPRK